MKYPDVMDEAEEIEFIISLIKAVPLLITMCLVAPFTTTAGYLKDKLCKS